MPPSEGFGYPRRLTDRLHRCNSVAFASLILLATACSGDSTPPTASTRGSAPRPVSPSAPVSEVATAIETRDRATPPDAAAIVIGGAGISFDHRLLGTNLPAWLGPQRLGDPAFQSLALASGTTVVRMPGGSWSNSYDWSACEVSDEDRCFWTWAARPTDFIDFLNATGLEGMWTVSINHTAQSAAAAVAFFNGLVDDDHVIGVDRNGVDWGTVGRWAELRTAGGNLDPVGITLWEVGNEVFGGRPESGGAECASFGWEDVWTCDGMQYITGTTEHDGYSAIRAAMVAVDAMIEVGAVGVADTSDWGNWGNEVIDSAGDELDFYVIHDYGFDASPDPVEAVMQPSQRWPTLTANLRENLTADIPIALTEYNLVSFEGGDTEQQMTRATNALYVADTIGQLATQGVAIANHWNLANGVTASGTDYGMIRVEEGESYEVYPQYESLAIWARAGSTMLDLDHTVRDLGVYPTLHDDGCITIIFVNRLDEARSPTIVIDGQPESTTTVSYTATLHSAAAANLSDMTMVRETTIIEATDPLSPTLPPWSIAALDVQPIGTTCV